MSEMQGKKFDQNKPRMSLLPKGALNAVIRVLEFGATKYQADNWKHVPEAKTRYYDAMQRHIEAWKAFNTKHAGKRVGRSVNGYLYVPIKRRHYSIHRIIFFMFHGYEPYIVDHIDGNPLNNKIENLRAATNSQNQANTRLSKANTSGYKGVYFHKSTGLWQASVRKDKKLIHLGLFQNIEDAVKARRTHFEELHGEFTRHE